MVYCMKDNFVKIGTKLIHLKKYMKKKFTEKAKLFHNFKYTNRRHPENVNINSWAFKPNISFKTFLNIVKLSFI